jgi:glycosyltransferase involved in cell wall biosynthesis
MTGDSAQRVRPELSVIIPVLNEAENIAPLLARLAPILERCAASHEIIFVDDGSTDATLLAIHRANHADSRVGCISFSRNFGKEVAIAAGLDHAAGRASVILDADLQHPPEMIETFVARWREGYKNVYGQRIDRSDDSRLRRALTQRFYQLFGSVGETSLPEGAGDFRLLDAQAVAALRALRERARFNKGLYAWIGFKSIGVPFDVESRAFGVSKFSYTKLTRFALDGLMSFSTMPLMVWTYVGTAISVLALASAIYFVGETMLHGTKVPGYASLIVSVTFLAGVQLLSLGVLGEYIGRIFAEVKRRPLYLVQERIGGVGLALDGMADSASVVSPSGWSDSRGVAGLGGDHESSPIRQHDPRVARDTARDHV